MTRFTVLFLAAASAAATLAAVSADTVKLLSPNDLALMTDHHHHQEHNEIEQKNEASDSFESLHLFGDPIAEASDSLGHYGPPPSGCLKDEQAFQIQGVPGMICAPKCDDMGGCPKDKPDGVTAMPQCALSNSATGDKYCVLICHEAEGGADDSKPQFLRAPGVGDAQCGDADCHVVQQGMGICTYSAP